MKVRVLAYEGHLVILPNKPTEGQGQQWWPRTTNDPRDISVLEDTKENLGVSLEALALLGVVKQVQPRPQGEYINWYAEGPTHSFGWAGPLCRLLNPMVARTSRNFVVSPKQCTVIANILDDGLREELNAALKAKEVAFREPLTAAPRGLKVNGRDVPMPGRTMSYQDLMQLTFPGSAPSRILSMTYRGKYASGTLTRGQSVTWQPDLVVNVADTSNA